MAQDIISLLPRDAIPAIVSPERLHEGPGLLPYDEPIVGVSIRGSARAYPLSVLTQHEIVNDRLGEKPIAVTYCPLCASSIVFDRRVGNGELIFKVSGKLYKNDLVMYDTATDSLWSQILGLAIEGPLRGAKLAVVPCTITTWASWRGVYINSTHIEKPADPKYQFDPYAPYRTSTTVGPFGMNYWDGVMHPKELVLGVSYQGKARAYPIQSIARAGIMDDVFEEVPMVIAHDSTAQITKVYESRVAGQTLSFTRNRDLLMQDHESGSSWSIVDGRAVSGKLAGASLREVPALTAYWFAWKGFHPATEVWSV